MGEETADISDYVNALMHFRFGASFITDRHCTGCSSELVMISANVCTLTVWVGACFCASGCWIRRTTFVPVSNRLRSGRV